MSCRYFRTEVAVIRMSVTDTLPSWELCQSSQHYRYLRLEITSFLDSYVDNNWLSFPLTLDCLERGEQWEEKRIESS